MYTLPGPLKTQRLGRALCRWRAGSMRQPPPKRCAYVACVACHGTRCASRRNPKHRARAPSNCRQRGGSVTFTPLCPCGLRQGGYVTVNTGTQ